MAIIDKFDLSGRTALVTGASSGLGWRFAEALAEQGALVVLAARRTDRLEELKGRLEAGGGRAMTVALDVTDRASIQTAFSVVADAGVTADIVVNNAGVAREAMALDMTAEDWSTVMSTNLDGVWFVAQEAARRMVAAETGGSIINIASLLGLRVAQTLSAYAVAKAGVIQMTKALALEWARHGIRVNAIAPGYVLTEINRHFFESDAARPLIARIPQRRIAEADELDGVLLLLASSASSFMTGSVIAIDGGHSLALG